MQKNIGYSGSIAFFHQMAEAAEVLCWEVEGQKLMNIINDILKHQVKE